MPVDFVKSGDGNHRSKSDGYDIEYTNPDPDQKVVKPKRGNLLSGLFQSKPKAIPVVQKRSNLNQAVASSAPAPSAAVKAANTYQPITPTVTTPVTNVKAATAENPVAKTVTFTERHLPPPPPPPEHAIQQSKQTQPTVVTSASPVLQPSIQPAIPVTPAVTPAPIIHQAAPQPTSRPVKISPPIPPNPPLVPAVPATPVTPAATATVVTAAPNPVGTRKITTPGEVVAHNVSGIRGKVTSPEVPHAMMLGVNLLPNVLTSSLLSVTPLFRLFRAITITTLMMSVIYLSLVGVQAYYVVEAESKLEEIAALDEQILSYRSLQTSILQSNMVLTTVNDLLENHVYWTNGLAFLEEHTLATVSYTSFTGSINGTINLSAIAPDYQTVAQQLLIWESLEEVTAVSVTTVTRSDSAFAEEEITAQTQSTVQFNLSLIVDPSVLHYSQSL